MCYRLFPLVAALLAAGCAQQQKPTAPPDKKPDSEPAVSVQPPPITREFRAAWVATVANIDWPSKPGLPTEEQQAELIAILDKAAAIGLNAIIFQVRPVGDAFYKSESEPWSAYLTGALGKAPDPPYDPLAMAVEESHKRGIELHAWFNPFRVQHPSDTSVSPRHITQRKPQWVRKYGEYLWLDPGEPAVHDYVLGVIADVVDRYDVDGIHFDDYFYPYPIKDPAGKPVDFPDEATWNRYVKAGGALTRGDWRRDNINRFMQRLYATVHEHDSRVRVGISPFGIWRPGHPEQIEGFDAYDQIYVDSRLWLQEGWLDYFTPQLYWAIDKPAQSYPVLLKWWASNNPHKRHLWPGLFTSRIKDGRSNWPASEIINQVYLTRVQEGAEGHVHFSMKALMANRDGIADQLAAAYAAPALVPASTWLDDQPPPSPQIELNRSGNDVFASVTINPSSGESARWWVVQVQYGDRWINSVLPSTTKSIDLPLTNGANKLDLVAVSAVDPCGNQSTPVVLP